MELPSNLWETEASYNIFFNITVGLDTYSDTFGPYSTVLTVGCGSGSPAVIRETSTYTDASLSGTQTKEAKTEVNFFTLPQIEVQCGSVASIIIKSAQDSNSSYSLLETNAVEAGGTWTVKPLN